MKPKFKDFSRHVMSRENGVIRIKQERTTLEIPDAEGLIYSFIQLLDGTRTKEDIAREMMLALQEVEEGIALLDRYRLMQGEADPVPALTEREQLRYKNNLTYFATHEDIGNSRYDYQRRLKEATVAVVGLGGGSVIAGWLAAMGVGTIVGVDFDRVELNNLNRQFFYTEDDIGQYKTDALKKRLNALNKDVRVVTFNREIDSATSLIELLSGVDLVVGAIDSPPVMGSRYINSACLHLRIPSYYAAIGNKLGFYYRVLPFESGCTDCRLIHILRTDPEINEQMKRKWYGNAPDVDFGNPGFAPNVAIMTSLIASEIAKQLTGYAPTFDNPFGLVDFEQMQVSHRHIPKSAECPSCGASADQGTIEPPGMERLFSIADGAELNV